MCSIEGCGKKVFANGFCSKHYLQLRKYGKVFLYSYRDKTNHIELLEDYAEIYLIDINNEVCAKALIDLEDVEKVKSIKWNRSNMTRSTYYCHSNNKEWKCLHRLIMNVTDPNLVVDHINLNGLDNRKSNLRICTNQENICNCKIPKNNKSGCKGVYWSKRDKKWKVQVTINNKTKYIGTFKVLEEAILARIDAAKKYYGEYANDEKMVYGDTATSP